jgi:Tol biopolymer transport system component
LNKQSQKWEIIAVSPGNQAESVVVVDGVQPSISRSNNLLAYQSKVDSSIGLHVVNLQTGEDVRATTFAEDVLPHWTASGRDFIFDTQRSGDRRWQVMVGYADGKGEPTVLFDGRTAAPSVVSNLIAYQGTDAQGNNPGIYIVPRSGGDLQRLTTDESDRSPAFSPDHSQLAFMSTRNGNWDIWTVPVKGGEPKLLVSSPSSDGLPTWSPDGSQLAYVSDQGGSWGIYVVSAAGGSPKKVANWGGDHPDWLIEQISWGP